MQIYKTKIQQRLLTFTKCIYVSKDIKEDTNIVKSCFKAMDIKLGVKDIGSLGEMLSFVSDSIVV